MTTPVPTFTPSARLELDDDGRPIHSNTIPWLLRRRTGLGASEAPAVLGLSKWSSPRDVALGKRAETISDEQTEAMEFGHLMEPIAIELFRRRHGDPENTRHKFIGEVWAPPGLLRSVERPHLLASLDAVIIEPDGTPVPGQVKNVTAYKRGAWAESEGGVPDDVRVQVIQEAMVLGSDHGWVLPIFGGNHMPEPIRVDADPEFVQWYGEYSAEWWQQYVEEGVEPPPTMLDDLSEIWRGVMGESVDLPPELVAKLDRFKRLGKLGKRVEEARATIGLEVKSFMGDATEGWERDVDGDRLVATWRPHKGPKRTFNRTLLEQDHPELADLLNEYTFDGATPRPFLAK